LLVDLKDLYALFITDYSFYEKLMDFCLARALTWLEAVCVSGVDTVSVGGNTPGGFLGREYYEKYILKYEKKYIESAKRLGVRTIYHNCGEIMCLVESYKKLGTDVVESFAPPPILGDGDLRLAKTMSEGTFAIIGNIDQVEVLKNGTVDLVRKVTKETVEIGKPGGKFILQSADYLEAGTPIDNVKAYIETGLKYGQY
jgi:uroporphyrinogen-III decarboxylase